MSASGSVHAFCYYSFTFYLHTRQIKNLAHLNPLEAFRSSLFTVLGLGWAQPFYRSVALDLAFAYVHLPSRRPSNPLPWSPRSRGFLSISGNKVSLWDDTLDFVICRVRCSLVVADGHFVPVSLRKTAKKELIRILFHIVQRKTLGWKKWTSLDEQSFLPTLFIKLWEVKCSTNIVALVSLLSPFVILHCAKIKIRLWTAIRWSPKRIGFKSML